MFQSLLNLNPDLEIYRHWVSQGYESERELQCVLAPKKYLFPICKAENDVGCVRYMLSECTRLGPAPHPAASADSPEGGRSEVTSGKSLLGAT